MFLISDILWFSHKKIPKHLPHELSSTINFKPINQQSSHKTPLSKTSPTKISNNNTTHFPTNFLKMGSQNSAQNFPKQLKTLRILESYHLSKRNSRPIVERPRSHYQIRQISSNYNYKSKDIAKNCILECCHHCLWAKTPKRIVK